MLSITQGTGISLAVVITVLGLCVAALRAYSSDLEQRDSAISAIMIKQAEMKVEQVQSDIRHTNNINRLTDKLDILTDIVSSNIASSRLDHDRILTMEVKVDQLP